MFTCQKCKKEFSKEISLRAHYAIHSSLRLSGIERMKTTKKNIFIKRKNSEINSYLFAPKKCKECKKELPYDKRNNSFCDTYCSAKFREKRFIRVQSKETKQKISNSLRKSYPLIDWECPVCHKIVKLQKYKAKYKKYCSRECSKTMMVHCPYGSSIRKTKTVILNQGDLSSKHKRVSWICPVCNKELFITLSDSKTRKFCSGTCRNKINNKKINGQRSKAEKILEEKLLDKFPTWNIIFNDRQILDGLELDVYIPHLKIGIEWNGIYHFIKMNNEEKFKNIQNKDAKKLLLCKEKGIDLIVISDLKSHKKIINQEIENIIEKLSDADAKRSVVF